VLNGSGISVAGNGVRLRADRGPVDRVSHGRRHDEGERGNHAWFSISDALPGLAMDVSRAARRIVTACARGELSLVLSLPARLAVAAHAALPGATIRLLILVNRLLPGIRGGTTRAVRGRDSESAWSPSILTRPGERAARTQNQG
jgi:hypothetical protein